MTQGPSNSMTIKRIHREVADLRKEDLGGMSLEPNENNLFHWTASIPGPEGSPYEGGVFNLSIDLASDYPFTAPKVSFLSRIYHMNISDRGNVCIDVLKQNWSPALSLYKVLLSLSSLLTDPNPKDPLVPSIANEYVRNRQKHDNTARQWTRLYATPRPKTPPLSPTVRRKGKEKEMAVVPVSSEEIMREGESCHDRHSQAGCSDGNNVIDLSSESVLVVRDESSTGGQSERTEKRKRSIDSSIEVRTEGVESRRRRLEPPSNSDVIVIDD